MDTYTQGSQPQSVAPSAVVVRFILHIAFLQDPCSEILCSERIVRCDNHVFVNSMVMNFHVTAYRLVYVQNARKFLVRFVGP